MLDYEFLQDYSWVVVSFLAATYIYLTFVYSAGAMIYMLGGDDSQRSKIFDAIDTKWRFTLATLLLFFLYAFTAFPGFQNDERGAGVSFWTPYLLLTTLHAISCETLRRDRIAGWLRTTCRCILVASGWIIPFMMGFFGSGLLTGPYNISIVSIAVGLLYVAASQTAALLYLYRLIPDSYIQQRIIRALTITSIGYILIIIASACLIFSHDAVFYDADGVFTVVPLGYLTNIIESPYTLSVAIGGVSLSLIGIVIAIVNSIRRSFWYFTTGSITLVSTIFAIAGLNGTACFPNFADPQHSLSIANSCASQPTLFLLFVLSFILPILAWVLYNIWNRSIKGKWTL